MSVYVEAEALVAINNDKKTIVNNIFIRSPNICNMGDYLVSYS